MRPDDRCRSNAVSNQKTWAGCAPLRRVLGVRPPRAGCRAVRDSTLVAWYRCFYAPRTGGAYDSHHPTAGVACRTRRLAARAQQPTLPVIGFLYPGPPETIAKFVTGFRKGLGELGYVEGRNVAIEYRWGYDQSGRLPELAADLVSRPVAVIVTPSSAAAALAA